MPKIPQKTDNYKLFARKIFKTFKIFVFLVFLCYFSGLEIRIIIMKGIILSGGAGSRLSPITKGVSKQLLPIYDKPMVYYPLSVLLLSGIREILVITTPEDNANFKRLLSDGSQWGISIEYAIQEAPKGIAEAFIIGREFIGDDSVCLILGDNVFHGANFRGILRNCVTQLEEGSENAFVFTYHVQDPQRYGVATYTKGGKIAEIEEKPKEPKSNEAVVGLYFYPNDVVKRVVSITPSARGELEITSVNQSYLNDEKLIGIKLPRGFAWLDTGTFDSLLDASNYVATIQRRQGLEIASPLEIAKRNKWL